MNFKLLIVVLLALAMSSMGLRLRTREPVYEYVVEPVADASKYVAGPTIFTGCTVGCAGLSSFGYESCMDDCLSRR